jgi:hypothetical protein
MGTGNGDWTPVPGVHDGDEGRPAFALLTLEVDGEVFTVGQAADGGWAYEWLSGPNEGYGFGISGPPNPSTQEHCDAIRGFLSMIDPATGYIGDE